MDERILGKLKDQGFAGKLAKAEDVTAVKKLFSDEGMSVTDSDVNEVGNLFQDVAEKLQQMPEDEINKVSGGFEDGGVYYLSDKFSDWAYDKYRKAEEGSRAKKFYDKLNNHSDKIVEGVLAVALIGGTIGAQQLYKYAKGWWIGRK